MHFLQHLLRYMLPIQTWLDNEQSTLPPGFAYVVNHENKFVVTSSGNIVIAKE